MKLYKHESYEEYVEAQKIKNHRKLDRTFASPGVLNQIIEDIRKNIPNTKFGICHGVRNGWEVEYFRKELGIEVIGTEISDTATRFDNVIEWDFHNVKDEWIGSVDFIYSNSFDHSFDPELALQKWMSCLNTNGRLYIEWTTSHNVPVKNDAADCFSASIEEYKELISDKYEYVGSMSGRKDGWTLIVMNKKIN
jgi:SAM-dependent methyltransferase